MQFTNRLLLGVILVGCSLLLWLLIARLQSSDAYPDLLQLELVRKNKDLFFKTSPLSPIPEDRRASFQGLHYFAPTNQYRFPAFYIPISDSLTETLGDRPYRVAGFIRFRYQNREYQLKAYFETDSTLFVPFSDRTNGVLTYEGGRYLTIPLSMARKRNFHIDFNYAYFPYCAYNPNYLCPKVPVENHLPFPIKAGERY
jgi:uncharacterized protein (DUF1684 family)